MPRTTITQINKITMPEYHTKEIKGYFRAPYTGRYLVEAHSDDGIRAWISSEYTSFTYRGKAIRRGVDDLAGLYGDTRHEYFKGDGFRKGDDYNYHRDNTLIRTGWRTTNENLRSNRPGDRYVDLEGGKYYFVRVLTANNKGPGYSDIAWVCTPPNQAENFTLTIDDTEKAQNWTAGTTKRGRFEMSGRNCSVETPDDTSSNSSGNNSNNNAGGGGNKSNNSGNNENKKNKKGTN
ncbi:uncharacterized protein METZ01_LOCUS487401, partial [marine metagenome]